MGYPGHASAQRETPGLSFAVRTKTEGLSRHQRLTQTSLFRETYAQGRKWVGRYMVLWIRTGEGASLRLGVVSSRKVGNAVARVRARRRLRECYRRLRARFSGEYDVIFIARRSILKAKWDDLVCEMLRLTAAAGLWDEKE